MTDKIKFGTDGWRAVMGEDFTDENVGRVIQAYCDLYQSSDNKKVYVGFDRRKNSDQTAKLVASILAENGYQVFLADQFCPTPCVSWSVKNNSALVGIMITASHNPPKWNGIKFKESYGGAASPAYTNKIEEQIVKNDEASRQTVKGDFEVLVEAGKIDYYSPLKTYVQHLRDFLDIDLIKSKNYKVAVDPLFGSGTGYVREVLEQDVIQIHDAADPNFGGLNPEPIALNLGELKETILKAGADIGLATDGDADRIGAYDEKGNFVNSHQIFALLILHNIRNRGYSGAIVKAVSTTEMIDKICAKLGVELIETPIGFKHISIELLKHNALMGGEESGGISLREHVHERDGVLNGLLLVEMMATQGKSLSELIADMEAEFGTHRYNRNDYHIPREKINAVTEKASQKEIKEVGGIPISRYNFKDGYKFHFEDSSWLMVRASGTEPLLRVYSEGPTDARVSELLGFAKTYFDL